MTSLCPAPGASSRAPTGAADGAVWVALVDGPLPLDEVRAWARHPTCGANVVFTGSVRDHSPGRPGVERLVYEAYDEWVVPKLAEVVAATRERWPDVVRAAALHRHGALAVGEDAVVVAVCTPHRSSAFAAAAYLIDAVKDSVPLWKHEQWAGGAGWSACHHSPAGTTDGGGPRTGA